MIVTVKTKFSSKKKVKTLMACHDETRKINK